MNFTARLITKHHRARLIAWTLSMLVWMLRVLFDGAAFASRHERQRARVMSLAWLARRVKLLIISRAGELARSRPIRRLRLNYRGQRRRTCGFVNAILGVRVRGLLKRKSVFDRIASLIEVLRHIDVYAALVAKRLGRGLTRRSLHLFALTPAPDAVLATPIPRHACFADSS